MNTWLAGCSEEKGPDQYNTKMSSYIIGLFYSYLVINHFLLVELLFALLVPSVSYTSFIPIPGSLRANKVTDSSPIPRYLGRTDSDVSRWLEQTYELKNSLTTA